MYRIRVPATSANLGPAFDSMGLAVNLYNYFTAEPADTLEFILTGRYTDYISANKNNLFWKSACTLWKKLGLKPRPFKITLDSNVPPARGLGSSSTALVGGLLLANASAGYPLDRFELLKLATRLEGHPDNVTPALYGGITLTVMTGDSVVPRVLAAKPKFKVVVAIPDFLVETEKARTILPSLVSRADVIFNSSRVGLLVDVFLREEYELLKIATEDRIHQNWRAPLIPGMPQALEAAVKAGAYGAVLSGSGPALLAFCPYGAEEAVAQSMTHILIRESGQETVSLILDIDGEGAYVTEA